MEFFQESEDFNCLRRGTRAQIAVPTDVLRLTSVANVAANVADPTLRSQRRSQRGSQAASSGGPAWLLEQQRDRQQLRADWASWEQEQQQSTRERETTQTAASAAAAAADGHATQQQVLKNEMVHAEVSRNRNTGSAAAAGAQKDESASVV